MPRKRGSGVKHKLWPTPHQQVASLTAQQKKDLEEIRNRLHRELNEIRQTEGKELISILPLRYALAICVSKCVSLYAREDKERLKKTTKQQKYREKLKKGQKDV